VDRQVTDALRISTAPGTWGIEPVEDPEQAPWQIVLDEVAAAGFEGVELGPLGYLPTNPVRLSAELAARDLDLAAGYVMEPFHDPAQTTRILRATERTCSLLAGVGAATLVVIGSLVPERSASAGRPDAAPALEGWDRAIFLRTLGAVVQRAEERGLRAALHPHAGTFVEYEHEIDEILEHAGSRLGLCVDSGHCLYSGVDALGLLERHADRVRHVHLKDLHGGILRDAIDRGLSFEEAVAARTFCPLGDGDADLGSFLRALRTIGYRGWATYEQDRLASEYATARADAQRSLAHLERLGVHTRGRSA
jgi:inosose dehydratase